MEKDRILRLSDVKKKIGLGRSSIYAQVKRGTFPSPIKLGSRASGWKESELDNWIAARESQT